MDLLLLKHLPKDICGQMNVEAILKQKRLRTTKRQFSYESPEEQVSDALKKLKVSLFNMVVDVSIASLQERFKALGEVEEKFGVLLNFPDLPKEDLTKQCETLSNTLSWGGQSDLDKRELALEMQNFPALPKANMTTLELLTFLQEKKMNKVYPNMWVALRIAVTIPVTVAAGERSFSKLKLIKTYLRSSMAQEHLNTLALISINREVSGKISFDDTINEFAARKSRRVRL
ncbi:uncharacterized protein LOC117535419 [Gymnodraco acuticeps]|uniref:Uncharacterized protein LOC117535419 n=1 Tax=Gymnodraco acuticeps TaxID=8218 RepID=A0A6P8SXF4_GYMAC|nr:uncharacterized protein LOC117535419 [Gymnodraco acuticeps]